jgi:hypothetical protein
MKEIREGGKEERRNLFNFPEIAHAIIFSVNTSISQEITQTTIKNSVFPGETY